MKFRLIIDNNREEEVIVYSHKESDLTDEIRRLVENEANEIIGYIEREAYKLSTSEIYCVVAEDNNVYAITEKSRFRVKLRLYQLEEILGDDFVKINQSCIVNIRKIRKFDSSLGGMLKVVLTNGYSDYVSRRNIRYVKERLGVK
ncbi:MAG: LytTR family DNA-binding domain-containing protein [Acutalibacteraceae bacterium]|nr:LytTR family DNA-binding domain-containing protein [Acutalibacteraceae bacterium]